MKKAMFGIFIGYVVIATGTGVYILTHPEWYGEWTGKMMLGMNKVFDKEGI